MDEVGIKNKEVQAFVFMNTNVHAACYQIVFYDGHNLDNILYIYGIHSTAYMLRRTFSLHWDFCINVSMDIEFCKVHWWKCCDLNYEKSLEMDLLTTDILHCDVYDLFCPDVWLFCQKRNQALCYITNIH